LSRITVGLAGNPNVGKTTILNNIAGKNLKVGNWAGVTVEKAEVEFTYNNYTLHIIDIPGIYNLTATSDAEKAAVQFLVDGEIDVIVSVLDSSNLARNLLLTVELMELEKPTVLALNMADEARSKGLELDLGKLKTILQTDACFTVANSGEGIDELLDKIINCFENSHDPAKLKYSENVESVLTTAAQKSGQPAQSKYDAIRALESSEQEASEAERTLGVGITKAINDERWKLASSIAKSVTASSKVKEKSVSNKLDRVLLHPFMGIAIYIALFYLMFKISFDFSAPYMDWIDGFMNNFLATASSKLLITLGVPDVVTRFVSEAVIGGVGFVLTFVPLVAILYFFITFFEMSGYLPRIVFMMDRFMHRLGLHGNMMTPLLLGFGCNVPAIMATKNMSSKKDKILVTMMIPFMSCPARLVVFAFFAFIFFDNPALVIVSLYGIGVIVALITALLLRKSFLKGKAANFLLELPPYRLPSLKTVSRIVWAHVKRFIYKAGTFIFLVSIVVWVLLNLPPGIKSADESIAARIGKTITPVFEPIGLSDWRATTSLIPGFLAREVVLSSMGIIYKTSTEDSLREKADENLAPLLKEQAVELWESIKSSFVSVASLGFSTFEVETSDEGSEGLRETIQKSFTASSAYSFMILLLIYNSCVATVAIMIREIGRKASFLFLGYSFVAAWLLAFVFYNVSNLLWP